MSQHGFEFVGPSVYIGRGYRLYLEIELLLDLTVAPVYSVVYGFAVFFLGEDVFLNIAERALAAYQVCELRSAVIELGNIRLGYRRRCGVRARLAGGFGSGCGGLRFAALTGAGNKEREKQHRRCKLSVMFHVYDHSFRCAQGTKGNETRMP